MPLEPVTEHETFGRALASLALTVDTRGQLVAGCFEIPQVGREVPAAVVGVAGQAGAAPQQQNVLARATGCIGTPYKPITTRVLLLVWAINCEVIN